MTNGAQGPHASNKRPPTNHNIRIPAAPNVALVAMSAPRSLGGASCPTRAIDALIIKLDPKERIIKNGIMAKSKGDVIMPMDKYPAVAKAKAVAMAVTRLTLSMNQPKTGAVKKLTPCMIRSTVPNRAMAAAVDKL